MSQKFIQASDTSMMSYGITIIKNLLHITRQDWKENLLILRLHWQMGDLSSDDLSKSTIKEREDYFAEVVYKVYLWLYKRHFLFILFAVLRLYATSYSIFYPIAKSKLALRVFPFA